MVDELQISSCEHLFSLSPPYRLTDQYNMSEEETLRQLSIAFAGLKQLQPSVSFRVWHEEGEIKFFLSNLPPRNRRSRPTTPRRSEEELQPPPPPSPPPANQRGRGRKRQCVSTSTPDRQTEQIKDNRPSDSLQISNIQEDRDHSKTFQNQEYSIPSIPCSNSFQVLSNMEEDFSRPLQ